MERSHALSLQARQPTLVEFDGPVTSGFDPIELPVDFDTFSPKQQLAAKKLRAAQSIW